MEIFDMETTLPVTSVLALERAARRVLGMVGATNVANETKEFRSADLERRSAVTLCFESIRA